MKSIYLSNLNENTKEEDIIAHFSKFGEIESCSVFKFKDGRCKGFGKITLKDPNIYEEIMNSRSAHIVLSRRLNLEPFIDNGKEIAKKNFEKEERKICVLGIPKSMTEIFFKLIFEKNYGQIEKAYLRTSNINKVTNFGFIIFKEKKSAFKAIEDESIFVKELGVILFMKKFRSNREVRKSQEAMKMNNNNNNYSNINDNYYGDFDFRTRNFKKKDNKNYISYEYYKKNELPIKDSNLITSNLKDQYHHKKLRNFNREAEGSNSQNPMTGGKFYEPTRGKNYKSLNEVLRSLNLSFMNPNKFSKYIKNIIAVNRHIYWIDPSDFEKLELFYFNKKFILEERELNRIAKKHAQTVDENHCYSNLKFEEKRN